MVNEKGMESLFYRNLRGSLSDSSTLCGKPSHPARFITYEVTDFLRWQNLFRWHRNYAIIFSALHTQCTITEMLLLGQTYKINKIRPFTDTAKYIVTLRGFYTTMPSRSQKKKRKKTCWFLVNKSVQLNTVFIIKSYI